MQQFYLVLNSDIAPKVLTLREACLEAFVLSASAWF